MAQYSDQFANTVAVPAVPNKSNTHGRKRTAFCSGTIATAGGLAVGTKIYLFTLPKGARVLGGVWGNDATFSGAGVTINIGHAGDEDYLGAGVDTASLCHTAINVTAATKYGQELTADIDVYAITIGDVIVDTGTYYCSVDYMI